jgi:hypothetical protein
MTFLAALAWPEWAALVGVGALLVWNITRGRGS